MLWAVLVLCLYAFLQKEHAYHFFFIEQNYMFLPSWISIAAELSSPGGFSRLAGEYMVQFFMYPYVGAVATTLLLALIALLTARILKQVNAGYDWLLPACVPSLCLLFMHFDYNYNPAGTIAVLILLAVLCAAGLIRNDAYRLGYHFCMACGLFWLCGSVHILYILLVILCEFAGKKPLRYVSLLLVPVGVLLGVLSVQFALQGEYRFAFLPDLFYHNQLHPMPHSYYSWIAFVGLFLFALCLKPVNGKTNVRRVAEVLLPLVLVLTFAVWGTREYSDKKSQQVKKLDYLTRMAQWSEIEKESAGTLTNYLYLCYLNMALAEQGTLAGRMFHFDQRGLEGLLLKWNRTFSISILLSDVYFTIGNIAVAQEMAFEAYVSSMGTGNPRMLQRLVQTNLIYGEYKVAEKYIDLLEQTVYYKDWAKQHRALLDNDSAIEADPLLGGKRKGLVDKSFLSTIYGVEADLIHIAEQYPGNRSAVDYLGGLLLLSKNVKAFSELVDTYFGTAVLPVLPLSFQEAIIILYESEPEKWERFALDSRVIERYGNYRKTILANKGSQALPKIAAREFANTYWFYFMFK